MPRERWRACVDFPGYQVSSRGRVRRIAHVPHAKPPGILKPWNDHGYPAVRLRRDDDRVVKVYVHRLIGKAFYGLTDSQEIDHRQHDRADNTRIRVATRTENARNSRGWSDHSSRFKGVSWCVARQKWYACITIDARTKNLGHYSTEVAAARAYDAAASAAWGAFAFLNLEAAE